jgi:hypothetical protein
MKRALLVALLLAAPAHGASYGTATVGQRTLAVTGGEVRARGATLLLARGYELRLRSDRVTVLRRGRVLVRGAARPRLDVSRQTVRLARTRVAGTTVRARAALPGAEPPVPVRPAGAVDVAAAIVTWHVRDSFVRYLAAGEGIRASRGATAEPPTTTPESDQPLRYDFHFAFRDGWRDPATGRAYLRFTGRVTFSYRDHGIDLDVNDLEVQLDGASSRAVARFTGRGGTRPGNRRGVLVDLDPAAGLDAMPGAIPRDTAGAIFAGYYLAGDPFGWVGLAGVK